MHAQSQLKSVLCLSQCHKCDLGARLAQVQAQIVCGWGNPNADIMLVGEAPGSQEARMGKPFIGKAGEALDEMLVAAGIDRSSIYITNTIKCWPWRYQENAGPLDEPINGTPTPAQIRACREFLDNEIRIVAPKIIVALGGSACAALEGKKSVKITDRKGVPSLYKDRRTYVMPTLHPSYVLRNGGVKSMTDFTIVAADVIKHLQKAKYMAENPELFKPKSYVIIDSKKALDQAMVRIWECKRITFDNETDGLGVDAEILGVGIGVGEGQAYYLPFKVSMALSHGLVDFWEGRDISRDKVISRLKGMMEDEEVAKSAHNAKYDMGGLKRQFGITVKGLAWDTMCGAYILDENGSHKLDNLKNRYLDLLGYSEDWNKVTGSGKNAKEAPLEVISNYCCGDVDATYRLTHDQYQVFTEYPNYMWLMTNFYVPLMEVITDIEVDGVLYDVEAANSKIPEYENKLNELKRQIWSYSGVGKFDIDSPQQVAQVLFGKLGLKPTKFSEKTKEPSTDKAVLEALSDKHIVPKKIVEYRHIAKMKSTYMERMVKEADASNRLHLPFNPIGTVTGRLSSEGLQNIPNEKAIKSLFIVPRGCKMVQADLSQAEVRCFAHYANEIELIKAFDRGKIDVHCLVTSLVINEPYDDVVRAYETDDFRICEIRRAMKTIVFGILYGRGPSAVAAAIDKSVAEAQAFIDDFFNRFPNCHKWIKETHELVHKTGYVYNIFGRVRRIPAIFSAENQYVKQAERQAVNSIIQSTAADITNLALIQINKRLKQQQLPARIVLTVHDSIIVETLDAYVDAVSQLLVETMEMKPTADFKVRMRADIDIYEKWGIKADK